MGRTLRERLQAVSPKAHVLLSGDEPLYAALLDRAGEHGIAIDEALLAEAIGLAVEQGVAPSQAHVGDLYLAVACAVGRADALRRFEAHFAPDLDRAIAKSPTLGLSPPEFRQLVFDRLFVAAAGESPRISKYVGRGTLKAWLRVMTSRFIIDLSRRRARRRDRSTQPRDDLSEKLGASQDTELDYLRHVYGGAVRMAFEEAVEALSVRQRNLLRQRYLHETSGDALAKMYGVHRSTLFAWLEQARQALLLQVRTVLSRRVPGDQLESVIGMLGSELHLSVRRMLDSQLEPDAPDDAT